MGTHERQDRELQHPVAAGGNWMRGSAGGKRVGSIFTNLGFSRFSRFCTFAHLSLIILICFSLK